MKFSIIITSFNYSKYITRCIESCLNQILIDDFEILIIDDGSTDDTYVILEKHINNPKIKIYKNINRGIEYSSNYGIRHSSGEYVIRVDADDYLASEFLYEANILVDKKFGSFYYSNYFVIDTFDKIIEEIYLPKFDKLEILDRGDFLATGTIYKKKYLIEVGLYNEEVKNSGLENYELIINLLKNNKVGYHIKKPLFYYRRHSGNISDKKRESIISYGNNLFLSKKLGNYRTNKNHPYKLIL